MRWKIQVAEGATPIGEPREGVRSRDQVVRVGEFGEVYDLDVATSLYAHAAAAVPAVLPDLSYPFVVKIWADTMPEHAMMYWVHDNEFGNIMAQAVHV